MRLCANGLTLVLQRFRKIGNGVFVKCGTRHFFRYESFFGRTHVVPCVCLPQMTLAQDVFFVRVVDVNNKFEIVLARL